MLEGQRIFKSAEMWREGRGLRGSGWAAGCTATGMMSHLVLDSKCILVLAEMWRGGCGAGGPGPGGWAGAQLHGGRLQRAH